jgi:hypothetical protein
LYKYIFDYIDCQNNFPPQAKFTLKAKFDRTLFALLYEYIHCVKYPIIFYAVKMFSPGHKASQRESRGGKEGRESQARGEALRLGHALF